MGIAVRSGAISYVICTRHPDCSEGLEQFTLHFALYSFRVEGRTAEECSESEHTWPNIPDRTHLTADTLDAFPDISVQGTVTFTIIEGFKFHLGQFYRVFRPRFVIYFAISEISDTFAILNQKVYPSRASLRTQHTSPDGGIGRRAGLKHQWSNPCRFDPGSGYDIILQVIDFQCLQDFSFLPKPQIWSLLVTTLKKGDLKTPQNLPVCHFLI